MPAMVSVADVLFARAQVPPLSARVTVTVVPEVEAVAEQVVNPLVSATAGDAGTPVNAGSKCTRSLEPAASAPVALELRPTVHFVVAPALCRAPVKVTGAGEVAALMTTSEDGEAAAESDVVATVKPVAV